MTIQQVIDRILAYHPSLGEHEQGTCDGFKCGNPQDECTGIVTTCQASVAVIREAIRLGANLIVVHEPTFYTHMDKTEWLQGNPVYEAKRRLLDEHGIAVWRDHDHIHAHEPDGIFSGVAAELGWELNEDGSLKNPTTVREMALDMKEKMGLNAVRVIGNLDATVTKVVLGGHLGFEPQEQAIRQMEEAGAQVLLPGETIDWTVLPYARDAGQMGMDRAIIAVGHISWEELGMKHMVGWLGDLIDHALPITFVRSADMYQYVLSEAERVDLFDENDRPLGRTALRHGPRAENEWVRAVGAWIFDSRGRVFMTRRSPEKRFMPNRWENTGGGVQAGETPEDAMLRELAEEIGLTFAREDLVFLKTVRMGRCFGYNYAIRKDFPLSAVTLQPGETCQAGWFTRGEFDAMCRDASVAPSVQEYLELYREEFESFWKNR